MRDFIEVDFNGLFGDLLCISHGEDQRTIDGRMIPLRQGMEVVAFVEDAALGMRHVPSLDEA